jgi:uncharacterized protein (TIGR03067 family)
MNVPASLLLLGLGCFPGAAPDDTSAKALKSLQGFWLFEKGERNDAGLWSLPEEGIYIEGNLVRHVKKNGELIFNGSAAEITVDASKTPFKIDLVRKNGKPGQKVLGIFKIEEDQLVIATNTKSEDTRPGEFSTKLSAGPARATNLQTYKLVKPEVAKKPASDVKLTPEEIAAAVDKAMKELQGQWIFEKSERNGFSYWVLPEESIYIEKNLLRHVKKNGEIIFNGSAAEISIEPTNMGYIKITLTRKNGNPGQKVLGIFKFEGDKLIIATNTSDDNKEIFPGQFTVRLSAGLERAAIVQTYKRAPKN